MVHSLYSDMPVAGSSSSSGFASTSSRPILYDPLDGYQKRKIYDFIQSYLVSDVEEVDDLVGTKKTVKIPIVESLQGDKALAKTYDAFDPPALEKAQAAIDKYHASRGDGKTFDAFRRVFKDPRLGYRELDIDPSRADQVFAAQLLMKVVIKNTNKQRDFYASSHRVEVSRQLISQGSSIEASVISEPCSSGIYEHMHYYDVLQSRISSYNAKIFNEDWSLTGNNCVLKEKNRLLMQNDPVEKQDPAKPLTPLSIVLSHSYFQDQQLILESDLDLQDGTLLRKGELYGPTREEVRETIKALVTKLWDSEETRHVIEALAALMTREKGNIIFSGTGAQEDRLWGCYNMKSYKSTIGGYNSRHTIFIKSGGLVYESITDPSTSEVTRVLYKLNYGNNREGTLAHESLHFLFNRIVKNDIQPVKTGSEEERLLDQALAKDRALREQMKGSIDAFTSEERSVWDTIAENLEKGYFESGFDCSNPDHLPIMRAESIVRIMEQVARGVPLETIRKIAPNLCNFYFTYSKPLLERYARGEEV
ncbi:MAG: hypothetical protein NTX49_09265 [Chlamydiae bacterium]|nr:hypothetical protein [Chlamydiota bacterium]